LSNTGLPFKSPIAVLSNVGKVWLILIASFQDQVENRRRIYFCSRDRSKLSSVVGKQFQHLLPIP
jgi:hypothetical protein